MFTEPTRRPPTPDPRAAVHLFLQGLQGAQGAAAATAARTTAAAGADPLYNLYGDRGYPTKPNGAPDRWQMLKDIDGLPEPQRSEALRAAMQVAAMDEEAHAGTSRANQRRYDQFDRASGVYSTGAPR